jgi:tetratricopeptide (TPR) repeat protein/predicted Ser/Thr protein kinase
MDTRWQRLDELFQAAIVRAPEERPAFLAEACAGDDGLRNQLNRLLRAHDRSTGFLETPVATAALRLLASADDAFTVRPPLTSFRAGTEFRGTARFKVRRQLGAGGMGVVYEVHDQVRNEVVALKTLLRARAADIYRLKREFRSLADVAHPNLVSLYELVVEGADCFFTMELVDGVNLVQYVRGSATRAPLSRERVRDVFRQLVEGIGALHDRGKLHRDIKPSNILITPAGRVVILDFGLASDVFPYDAAIGESMAGTPAYLAPERRPGVAPSESHDWYSMGATLYEALTGLVPFDGPFEDVVRKKRESDPCPPAEIAPDVPDDLNALCMGLLLRDPMQRMTGRDATLILERDPAASVVARPPRADADPPFVGRHRHLHALETALAEAKHGTATAVYVHGPSGIGKSALVQCFLDRVLKREDIVVLRGRCYEYESVPYKALDGVVDSLSRHLSALPRSQANPLLPPDLAALSRLFPVMLQVEAAASVRRREQENADPLVLRQRAFTALRELLARMAARRPLVVYIDDLHWADADSAVLLEELLRPPQAPPILTVACFRTEEIASKPFLQALLERTASKADVALPLEPMTDDEGRALLALALDMEAPVGDEEILEIARQAGGNPFLLRQLAGYLAAYPTRRNRVTFAEMLDERIRALSREGQRFLETLAVCGRPMAPELVCDACGVVRERQSLVAMLRSSRFIRSSGSSERVETYHDRIREVLAAQIAPDAVRRIHGLMVQALVEKRSHDHDALFEHYRGAGEGENAAIQAGLAAAKAAAALAFDRAAFFYGQALALAPRSPSASTWSEGLANALANAGRPAEAAAAYLRAAAGAGHPRQVELQRRGAEQFLIGGYIERGLDLIRSMLIGMGVGAPRGPRAALLSLLWRRAQLRWRGLKFVPRRVDDIDADTLLRVDTCWSVFTGFAMIDYVRAVDFHTRHLLLALDTGEPYRLARALAAEALVVGSVGGPQRRQAIQCAQRADAMAERAGQPHAVALCTLARGASAFLVGDWPMAEGYCDRALTMLRDHSAGTIWELNSGHVFRLGALLYQGKLREATRDVAALLASAKGRGNLYFETELRTRMNLVWLVADDPDEGEQQAREALQQWARVGFQRMHYNYMVDRIQTELYRGRPRAAWQVITESWTALERAHLLRVQFQRIEARYLRARCALLMAATARNPRQFLSIARADARRIRQEKMAWSDPLSCLVSATVAYLTGWPQVARDRLAKAAAGFERAHMKLYLAVVRRRLCEIAQDDASQEAGRQADGWMAAQGVVNPSRITRLIAPGFPDADMR